MRPDDPPPDALKLPLKGWRPSLRLRPRGGGYELTDWGRGRVFVGAVINAVFAVLSVPLLAGLGFGVWQSTQPPAPATTPPDLPSLLLSFALVFVLLAGLWTGLRVVTRTGRRFSVRVDPDRRECVARSRTLGVTRRRVSLELRGASADVAATSHLPPQRASAGPIALAVLGLLTGPLGWFIFFLTAARGRGNRQTTPSPAVDAVTLLLFDGNGDLRVAVTSGDETATAGFLAAWDAATR